MLGGFLGLIVAVTFYLLVVNAVGGPGGNKKAFEEGKTNITEIIEAGKDKNQKQSLPSNKK